MVRVLIVLLFGLVGSTQAEEASQTLKAHDSFQPWKDENPDAQQLLDHIAWPAADFEVKWEPVTDRDYQRLVRFPTPFPSGDEKNDSVSMEWYIPSAPAISARSVKVANVFSKVNG